MGTQTIFDLIGSTVIFGWLMLMTLRGTNANADDVHTIKGDLMVQQNLVEVTRLLEFDFRKMGYCAEPNRLPDPTKAILLADSDRIKFLTDIADSTAPDGVVDSLYYYVGSTSELSRTPNPHDRFLYRVVNTKTPKGASLGITQFKLKYFDAAGNIIPCPVTGINLQRIQTVQISLALENPYPITLNEGGIVNDQYSAAFWQQMRLSSRNYRNR